MSVRYEAEEAAPAYTLFGVGIQGAVLAMAPTLIIVTVTARAGGQGDAYLTWAVFAALIIAGALTAVQGTRLWRFGAGHVLIMGTTPNFVAITVLALSAGGPSLMASLVVVSSLFYLALANWLPLLRRIITPAVSGTALMLIAITVLPVAFDRVQEMPATAPAAAGPVIALATLVVTVALVLRGSGPWRLWSPFIGIAIGCAVAVAFGAYEFQGVGSAPWLGIAPFNFPGFELPPTANFWALLPVFLVITLVGGVKNIGDNVAIQQASRRRPRVTDFRLVQGSLNTNGLGIFLSGLAGTPPTTVYSSTSVALATMTGVAARRVGYIIGAGLVLLAFFPKLPAVLVTIPSPIMGSYLILAIGLLFVEGIRTVVRDGLDFQKVIVVGVSVTLGAGMEHQTIIADIVGGTWGGLLDNGMLVGAVAAVAMTQFLELTGPRRSRRLQVTLENSSLPRIDEFVTGVAANLDWSEAATHRLRSAAEETLLALTAGNGAESGSESGMESDKGAHRLIIVARPDAASIELEFMAVFDEENLQDRLAHLDEEQEGLEEGQIPLRLLRHYASSVQHQKYYGLDIVTVRVNGGR